MTDVIRDLPIDDRPRERLLSEGPQALSNAQLLAVLLGTGVRGMNAIQLARVLLSKEHIGALKRTELAQLKEIPGIGPAKVARVAAAFEISRRLVDCPPPRLPEYDLTSFGRSLVLRFAHARQETLGAAFLDARMCIMRQRDVFVGSVDRTAVCTRELVRQAAIDSASGIVIFHNHPSGQASPSEDDISFTRKLQVALSSIDVELVDHLVIGDHGWCSMKEKGLY
jgi:DNA repair protein RadC